LLLIPLPQPLRASNTSLGPLRLFPMLLPTRPPTSRQAKSLPRLILLLPPPRPPLPRTTTDVPPPNKRRPPARQRLDRRIILDVFGGVVPHRPQLRLVIPAHPVRR